MGWFEHFGNTFPSSCVHHATNPKYLDDRNMGMFRLLSGIKCLALSGRVAGEGIPAQIKLASQKYIKIKCRKHFFTKMKQMAKDVS